MKTYSKIAELQLKHTYFTSTLCPALSLKPTKNTATVMAKYNFVVREINGAYSLVCEDQENLKTYLDYITLVTEMDSFNFELVVEDANFFIFSNLPTDNLGTYVYSTGNQESDGVLKPELNTDTGVFSNVKFRFEDLAQNTNGSYQIQFQASTSIWNYIIINRSELNVENCYIKTNDENEFNSPVEMTLPTGDKAISFSSSKPISMTQTSKVSYNLAQTSQNSNLPSGKIIFKGLPIAGPINTSINKQNGEDQYVSSLYIYI
ncbi:MAG: hypothetical protein ACI8ZM_004009 [Crocinitomix sp.]|jgi:hypothetical protein